MKHPILILTLLTALPGFSQTIVCPPAASPVVKLAAKEIRRYVYLRTGKLLPLATEGQGSALRLDPSLGVQAFRISPEGISGGDDIGLLYGAYRFAEKLGVRFCLHGDVIPDERLAAIPDIEEAGKPIFALRGVNPWGAHAFGIDAWGTDDYKAVITQMAKMRMNFIGMHCYPEGHPYAEPTVWHGLTGDFDPATGMVSKSYVTRYFNTLLSPAWGNYQAKKTSEYSFGGARLFDDDAWAPEVFRGHTPQPASVEDCNDVFNRMGAQLGEAFRLARALGVKTCLGTETPLIAPKALAERSNEAQAIYEGTFRRIMATHPLDYFWLWTPEGWTWEGNKPEQYTATVADINQAIKALKNVKAPFQLATCGWVLGPAHDRAAFDRDMSEDIPMSAISRGLGTAEVDPAFGRISGRDKWAIPWLEGDGGQGLAGLQLWVGRMRRDAVDARKYGCTGLMGLHWRTDILAPNASALAQAAWDQSWAKAPPRQALLVDDFFADWAQANFGLPDAGKVFAKLDGNSPVITPNGCPVGPLQPDARPWSAVAPAFVFVDEFEALGTKIKGAGNLERFDYWLNTFKYLRALARTRCAMATGQEEEVFSAWSEASTCLLQSVNSPGALATVVTMENERGWSDAVAKHAGKPWTKDYQGKPRMFVPTVRSAVRQGESLSLKIIVLDKAPAGEVVVHCRPLGKGAWKSLPATHLARGVYRANLPAASEDFEYYLTAGDGLSWPATAPGISQTVVVLE